MATSFESLSMEGFFLSLSPHTEAGQRAGGSGQAVTNKGRPGQSTVLQLSEGRANP